MLYDINPSSHNTHPIAFYQIHQIRPSTTHQPSCHPDPRKKKIWESLGQVDENVRNAVEQKH